MIRIDRVGQVRAGPLIISIPIIITLGPDLKPEELDQAMEIVGDRPFVMILDRHRMMTLHRSQLSSPVVRGRVLEECRDRSIYLVPEADELLDIESGEDKTCPASSARGPDGPRAAHPFSGGTHGHDPEKRE